MKYNEIYNFNIKYFIINTNRINGKFIFPFKYNYKYIIIKKF